MNTFTAVFAVVMVALVAAEAPLPYNYNRPSSGLGGHSSGSVGGSGFGGSSFGGSSGSSFGSNEGAEIDPQVLAKVQQILVSDEARTSAKSASVPSGLYGAPAAPVARVVGVVLEHPIHSHEVASFSQQSQEAASSGYAYNAPAAPSSSYGAPAAAPSSTYGAPAAAPSSTYGVPH